MPQKISECTDNSDLDDSGLPPIRALRLRPVPCAFSHGIHLPHSAHLHLRLSLLPISVNRSRLVCHENQVRCVSFAAITAAQRARQLVASALSRSAPASPTCLRILNNYKSHLPYLIHNISLNENSVDHTYLTEALPLILRRHPPPLLRSCHTSLAILSGRTVGSVVPTRLRTSFTIVLSSTNDRVFHVDRVTARSNIGQIAFAPWLDGVYEESFALLGRLGFAIALLVRTGLHYYVNSACAAKWVAVR